jgi:mitochondrial fission protein ELM1
MFNFFKNALNKSLFKPQPTVWLLQSDPKRNVQSVELARNLTSPINIIKIIDTQTQLEEIKGKKSAPNFAIGCGRECSENLLKIKKLTNGKTKIIAILDPKSENQEYDYIITPSYEPHSKGANVIETTGLINFVNPKHLQNELKLCDLGDKHKQIKNLNLKPPFITVILGGLHTGGNITTHDAEKLAENCNKFAEANNATLLITSSARTEAKTIEILEANLKANYFLYDYKFGRTIENPYSLFIALADNIVVTGDSIRMMSEACSSGKNVFIYDSEDIGFQYKALSAELVAKNCANYFTHENFNKSSKSINEAKRIADIILQNQNIYNNK